MNEIALLTGISRLFIIYPLACFLWEQGHFHAKNGHVGMVRRATLAIVLFLTLMLGNLVWVNVSTALNNSQVINTAQWISFLSSIGLAISSWNLWSVFRKVR